MTDAMGFAHAMGVITPSGNLVVERVTTALLASVPAVSAHFARIGVRGAVDPFPDRYDMDGMLTAARLLADARPGVILWNGSKGGLIGVEHDRALASAITAETGIAATTSTLALEAVLRDTGARRIALATPYAEAYQARLVARFAEWGFETVAESHLGLTDNLSYASVPLTAIAAQIDTVAAARPDAILTWCTNYAAAMVAAEAERRTGIPVHDATTLPLWSGLRMLGVDTTPLAARWGSLFARPITA
ncbi:maleate cis-trans isomerase family protein [Elioraea rosea]|uniref:maleate cis-trans isomerase family protein n=1 Tax=Elioraea rosea TaxID=2492390 RepID=UPI001183667A|nr:Asp/Glu/hydantoin racemase [Elioraea rosea]